MREFTAAERTNDEGRRYYAVETVAGGARQDTGYAFLTLRDALTCAAAMALAHQYGRWDAREETAVVGRGRRA